MNFKLILNFFFSLFLVSSIFATGTFKGGEDFTITLMSLEDSVENDNINSNFDFILENLKDIQQEYIIEIDNIDGWDIIYNEKIILNAKESKDLSIKFLANSDFDYSSDVVSTDIIIISQKDDYSGHFEFPIMISSENNETISLKYSINILPKLELPVEYITRIATQRLSPISPLKYTLMAENLIKSEIVNVEILFGNQLISSSDETFTSTNYYQIFDHEISSDIDPGEYNLKLTIKHSDNDGKYTIWENEQKVIVSTYENIEENNGIEKGLFKDKYLINLKNSGNSISTYSKNVEVGFLKYFFFGSNQDYENTNDGIQFNIVLEKSEEFELIYYFNYLPVYILTIVFLTLVIYIYYRKNSNPLDVETKIYEIKKVAHEGVKSLKVRIGFENIKESEIDNIKLVFRMPTYLNIKDNSFLLSEPKKVLKGKSQYKLIWEFTKFDINDSRIIGFALMNRRGVLGDIKLPDLELEIKVAGKIRKYYKSFPVIKG